MNYPLITVTPAGRKPYLEILSHYLLQNRALIKEHHFWVNTTNQADIAYIEQLAAQHPDFFKLRRRPVWDNDRQCDSIWQYFQDYVADDTVYIRLDDDICFIAPDALPNLARFRTAHREPFIVYGNIVNNAICSFYQQARGFLPLSWGRAGFECMDPVAWEGKRFAQRLHEKFLDDLEANRVADWKFPPKQLDTYNRFSINVICWFGHDMRQVKELTTPNLYVDRLTHPLRGNEIYDEESMLTEYLPAVFGRPNMVCGDAVFGHFAFYPQRRYLERVTTLLDEYRDLTLPKSQRTSKTRRKLVQAVKPLSCIGSGNAWRFVRRITRERIGS